MLINLSTDEEIREHLAKDDAFLEILLMRITVCQFALIPQPRPPT